MSLGQVPMGSRMGLGEVLGKFGWVLVKSRRGPSQVLGGISSKSQAGLSMVLSKSRASLAHGSLVYFIFLILIHGRFLLRVKKTLRRNPCW